MILPNWGETFEPQKGVCGCWGRPAWLGAAGSGVGAVPGAGTAAPSCWEPVKTMGPFIPIRNTPSE